MLVCSNTSPRSLARRRARGGAAARARRARGAAQPAHRLRGAGLGPPRQALYGQAWEIVERADHPHLGLILDSFHTLSLERRPGGDRRDPRRADLLPADGRRAAARDGRAAVGAPLPLLPRPGPVRRRRLLRAGAARRLHRPALARDLQRRLPRDAEPAHRGRRDALAALPRERGARRGWRARGRRGARARSAASSCSIRRRAGARRLRLHRVRASTTRPPSARRACSSSSASPRRPPSLEAGDALSARARSISSSTREPGSFARERFDEQGPCVCAIGLRADDAAARRRARRRRCSRRASTARSAAASCALPAIVAPGGSWCISCRASSAPTASHAADFVARRRRRRATPPAPGSAASTTSRSACRRTSSTPGSCSAARVLGLEPARASSWPIRSAWSALRRRQRGPQRALRPQRLAEPAHAHRAHGRARAAASRRCITSRSTAPTSSPPSPRCASAACASSPISGQLLRRPARPLRHRRRRWSSALRAARHALRPRRRAATTSTSTPSSFADRFFFEIVQRRGYDAYGALNAPARMASQAQADADALTQEDSP